MREYVALHSVLQLPFKDLILSATEKNKIEGREWNVPPPLMDYLQTNLNDSQLDAIHVTFLPYYFFKYIWEWYLRLETITQFPL
jgi:hypothetical protein